MKRSHAILIGFGIQAVAMLILAGLARVVGASFSALGLTVFACAYVIPALAVFIGYARFAFVPSLRLGSRIGRIGAAVLLMLVGHIASVVALQFIDPWDRALALQHRFPVEIREATDSGSVSFIPSDYDDWIHEQIALAVWQQGGLYVRHAVYSRGAIFAFSASGLVFILEGAQNRDPCYWRGWSWWVGDPHRFQFPQRWYGGP